MGNVRRHNMGISNLVSSQKISNLTVIIDYNKWQATGRSNEILALEPLKEKWKRLVGILKRLMDIISKNYLMF